MLKKDMLVSTSKAKTKKSSATGAFRCGECLHFKKYPHPSHKEVCSKEGMKAYAICPASCFTPDVTQLLGNTDQFAQLAALFHTYNHRQRRILIALLDKKESKYKLSIGTKVYFRAYGRDYLSNYLSGYVMGYSSSGELMLCGTPDKRTRGSSYLSFVKDESTLLNASQWKAKRSELIKKSMIQDAKQPLVVTATLTDYEPPTIDQANATWHDKQEKKTKRTSKVRDLTTIIIQ